MKISLLPAFRGGCLKRGVERPKGRRLPFTTAHLQQLHSWSLVGAALHISHARILMEMAPGSPRGYLRIEHCVDGLAMGQRQEDGRQHASESGKRAHQRMGGDRHPEVWTAGPCRMLIPLYTSISSYSSYLTQTSYNSIRSLLQSSLACLHYLMI